MKLQMYKVLIYLRDIFKVSIPKVKTNTKIDKKNIRGLFNNSNN